MRERTRRHQNDTQRIWKEELVLNCLHRGGLPVLFEPTGLILGAREGILSKTYRNDTEADVLIEK